MSDIKSPTAQAAPVSLSQTVSNPEGFFADEGLEALAELRARCSALIGLRQTRYREQ